MKVIAINGSPKATGNTYQALKKAGDILKELEIETEIIHVGDKSIRGCIGCGACNKDVICTFGDEFFNEAASKIYEADGIIIGSPVYYAGMNGTLKSFLDRVFFYKSRRMAKKVGGAIAVCRRSGGMTTFEQINAYFLISDMFVAPSTYWTICHGFAPGDISGDEEGLMTVEIQARNIAWFLQMKEATKDSVSLPAEVPKRFTNFIR